MNVIALLNRTVLATLLLSASVTVFAGGGGGSRGPGPYPYSPTTTGHGHFADNAAPAAALSPDGASTAGSTASGKTRAQVRAELLQAEEAGLTPVHKNDYPPSPETIARNRERFQQVEQAWKRDGQVAASNQ